MGLDAYKLYQPQRSLFNIQEFQLLLKVWLFACGATMMILFLANEFYFSRGLFILTWFTVLVVLLVERYIFFKGNTLLIRLGFIDSTVLIYGTESLAKKLYGKLQQSPKLGYQVAGFVMSDEKKVDKRLPRPVLGSFVDLKKIIRDTQADKLFIAHGKVTSDRVTDILKICSQTRCQFQIIPSIHEVTLEKTHIQDMEGIPLIDIQEPELNLLQRCIKRFIDIVLGCTFLLLLAPLFTVSVCTLFLVGANPILERQTRVGKGGKYFDAYFFLSSTEKMYPIGHLAIKFFKHLDTYKYLLLINVLKGDMSLVGPKPQHPLIAQKGRSIQHQKFNVRPGWTGLWEIFSKETSTRGDDLDMYYIQNQSLLLDLIILVRVAIGSIYQTVYYMIQSLWKRLKHS